MSTPSQRLKVTVASADRRADLVLPGAVPVAELVPELARSVGLLEVGSLSGGYRLLVNGGHELAVDAGLQAQGVEDGGVLVVEPSDLDQPRRYDDLTEAVVDTVESWVPRWHPNERRSVTTVAAGGTLALAACSLLTLQPRHASALGLAGLALVLQVGALLGSRGPARTAIAGGFVILAVGCAVCSALQLLPPGAPVGVQLVCAGSAALLVGLVGLVAAVGVASAAVPRLVWSPVVAASLLAVFAGVLIEATGWTVSEVLVPALVVLGIAGHAIPALALRSTSLRADQVHTAAELRESNKSYAAGQPAIHLDQVRADVLLAEEIATALTATSGLVLTLIAPIAVGSGLPASVLAAVVCVLAILRTRRHRSRASVRAGVWSGMAGLSSLTVSLVVLRSEWRTPVTVTLVIVGSLLLVSAVAPGLPAALRGWLGQLTEVLLLASLLPLLTLSVGVLGLVHG